MSKANVLCIFMIGISSSFYSTCAKKKGNSIRLLDFYTDHRMYQYKEEKDELEHEQLWKRWMLIKDSRSRHIPFRDAYENKERLRRMIQEREKEFSQFSS